MAAADWDTGIYAALSRAREVRRLWQDMQNPACLVLLQLLSAQLAQPHGPSQPPPRRLSLPPPQGIASRPQGLLGAWAVASQNDPLREYELDAEQVAGDVVHALQAAMQL